MQIQKGFAKYWRIPEISRFSWDPDFHQNFWHFIRRCRLTYICLSPPSRPFRIISLLPFFLPINFLMYRYASRVASIRLDLAIFDSRRRILQYMHRLAYRYIRKLIGRKKGSREIMRNGREGGERQIYVNRQRRMKCQKFWWKSGSHENRDISGILQYFAKPFWICIDG